MPTRSRPPGTVLAYEFGGSQSGPALERHFRQNAILARLAQAPPSARKEGTCRGSAPAPSRPAATHRQPARRSASRRDRRRSARRSSTIRLRREEYRAVVVVDVEDESRRAEAFCPRANRSCRPRCGFRASSEASQARPAGREATSLLEVVMACRPETASLPRRKKAAIASETCSAQSRVARRRCANAGGSHAIYCALVVARTAPVSPARTHDLRHF